MCCVEKIKQNKSDTVAWSRNNRKGLALKNHIRKCRPHHMGSGHVRLNCRKVGLVRLCAVTGLRNKSDPAYMTGLQRILLGRPLDHLNKGVDVPKISNSSETLHNSSRVHDLFPFEYFCRKPAINL